MLSPLMALLHPPIRSVAWAVLSTQEKGALLSTVQLMLAYSLAYTQHRLTDSTYDYRLDPPFHSLILNHNTHSLPYVVKQVRFLR